MPCRLSEGDCREVVDVLYAMNYPCQSATETSEPILAYLYSDIGAFGHEGFHDGEVSAVGSEMQGRETLQVGKLTITIPYHK